MNNYARLDLQSWIYQATGIEEILVKLTFGNLILGIFVLKHVADIWHILISQVCGRRIIHDESADGIVHRGFGMNPAENPMESPVDVLIAGYRACVIHFSSSVEREGNERKQLFGKMEELDSLYRPSGLHRLKRTIPQPSRDRASQKGGVTSARPASYLLSLTDPIAMHAVASTGSISRQHRGSNVHMLHSSTKQPINSQ